jgi:hypothetical protein
MKGDFSRDTFNPAKHYSRVLLQQGRALLDADWNEQVAIFLEQQRAFIRDLLGPHAGVGDQIGFQIGVDPNNKLTITAGRYYVNGLMCNNPTPHISAQPLDLSSGPVLVVLDVWEHYTSSIEDPTIREVSLGGADTAARAKVVWEIRQVKNFPGTLPDGWDAFRRDNFEKRAKMSARLKPLDAVESDSTALNGPGDRGLGNQLYRVEVHQGRKVSGTATVTATESASFKWSRENGSVVTAWFSSDGNRLTVESTRGFEVGQWVELLDHLSEPDGRPGILVRVKQVKADVLVVDGNIDANLFTGTKVIRRWDHVSSSPSIAVTKDGWIDLENGIQIQFEGLEQFNTGDYWLIPSRGSTGTIEWPVEPDKPDQPSSLPPHGVAHHYAPLAVISITKEVTDLRLKLTTQVQPIPKSP